MLNNQESEIIQNLSEQEICELREAFNIFDKDSDGSIALDKLILLLKSLKQNPTQNEIKELAETFGNLKINFNQFLIIMAKRIQKKNIDEDKYFRSLFDVMDRNKNGKISLEEIKYLISHSNVDISDEDIKFLTKEADSDGDGLISYDEFLIFMKD